MLHPEKNTEEAAEAPPITESDLYNGLSETWFKTVQEILPGLLPDLPLNKLSGDKRRLYDIAYKLLGKMAEEGVVEMSFREEDVSPSGPHSKHTQLNRPQFKLKSSDGKKIEDHGEFGALRAENAQA